MSIVHAGIAEVADRPVGSIVTVRGKELPLHATVADARRVLESSSVQLIPVLDGTAYAGGVSRDDIRGVGDASRSPGWQPRARPTTTASTAAREALPALDRDGGRRLVVLADDGSTYVGLVCVSRDRTSLCVDAECHAGSADLPQATPG